MTALVEWDDGSALAAALEKYDEEKRVLLHLRLGWLGVFLGALLLPVALLPIFDATAATLGDMLATFAFLAGNTAMVVVGTRAALDEELDRQSERIARQVEEIRERSAMLDRFLEA